MTNVVAIGDLHGHLGFSLPRADLLIIAGDIVPMYSRAENQNPAQELDWLKRMFTKWLVREVENSGIKSVLVSGGNHDCLFEHDATRFEAYEWLRGLGVHMTWRPLDHGSTYPTEPVPLHELCGVHIVSYNLSPTINQRPWPFSVARGSSRQRFETEKVIEAAGQWGIDVFVTHAPPAGLLDRNKDGDHCGCGAAARIMHEVMPRFVVCGHIHEERGNRDRVYHESGREIRLINCSIMDRTYSHKGGKPRVFDV